MKLSDLFYVIYERKNAQKINNVSNFSRLDAFATTVKFYQFDLKMTDSCPADLKTLIKMTLLCTAVIYNNRKNGDMRMFDLDFEGQRH